MYQSAFTIMRLFLRVTIIAIIGIVIQANSISVVHAIAVEQHIEIIDQEYTTSSLTDVPTNNSLGLVSFDPAKYNGETVYFEALVKCDSCSGGNAEMDASLVTESGGFATSVSTNSNSYVLVRSGSVSLSQDKYTVRIKLDATTGTAYVKTARLVLVQNASPITDTQTQIEVGNNESFGVSTTAIALTDKKIWRYDSFNASDTTGTHFTATVWRASGSGSAYACLYTVGGSEVGCVENNTSSPLLPTPVSVSLSTNTEYEVRLKSSSGSTETVSLANAKVIITQSQAAGIKRFETYYHLLNTSALDFDSTYTNQETLLSYNPTLTAGGEKYSFFESTLKTSAGTAYAQLYNSSDTAAISGSETTTTQTSYARERSANIQANLPGSTKTLDIQLKNSGLNTTVASNAWIISQLIVDPSLTFSVEAVDSGTVHNGITTSISSTFNTLPFGHLSINTPKYVGHKLSVTANTNAGYSVTAKLLNALQGVYPANNIDAFGGGSVTWGSPQTWTSPTGTSKNEDTGWIGANTTDTRVSGWSSADQKFGPIDQIAVPVMYSSGGDAGTTAYVTYALEANSLQPADLYSDTLIYNVLPSY